MKKNIITLFAVLIALATQAQTGEKTEQTGLESKEIETVFKQMGPLGWWVSPDFAWTRIDGEDAFLGGLSGGIIIDHSFSLGLAGSWLIPSDNLVYGGINDTADVYLYGGYGGLKLEYRLNPSKKIHVAFPLLIGGGSLGYSVYGPGNWPENDDDDYDYDYDYGTDWDGFFVIEPGVTLGVNLLKFMRLDAGVSYRIAPGIDLPNTESNLFNGLNTSISLKFGRF